MSHKLTNYGVILVLVTLLTMRDTHGQMPLNEDDGATSQENLSESKEPQTTDISADEMQKGEKKTKEEEQKEQSRGDHNEDSKSEHKEEPKEEEKKEEERKEADQKSVEEKDKENKDDGQKEKQPTDVEKNEKQNEEQKEGEKEVVSETPPESKESLKEESDDDKSLKPTKEETRSKNSVDGSKEKRIRTKSKFKSKKKRKKGLKKTNLASLKSEKGLPIIVRKRKPKEEQMNFRIAPEREVEPTGNKKVTLILIIGSIVGAMAIVSLLVTLGFKVLKETQVTSKSKSTKEPLAL